MTFDVRVRASDSAVVESVMHGYTIASGSTIRPSEIHWHMVLTRFHGETQFLIAGPLTNASELAFGGGAEILWIKFKLGTYLPHLPTRELLNTETVLPDASSQSIWLKSSAWQHPTFENAETFVHRLIREEILVHDPLIPRALCGEINPQSISERTLRHRFLNATGMSQSYIMQYERAQKAFTLLKQGYSILDTAHEAGYFDQPHLTRSLKQFVGYTPAQISRQSAAARIDG